MVMKLAKNRHRSAVFLLDRAAKRAATFAPLHPRVVSTRADLRSSLASATKDSLWVSYAPDLTHALVKGVAANPPSLGLGLFVHTLDVQSIPVLSSAFRRIAFTPNGGFLPADDLAEVLSAENRSDLFLGGFVNRPTETITLWRGNLESLTVPFSAFPRSGDGTEPDFDAFSIVDSGQTVRLGQYEAAVDAILYEFDPEYRRRISKKRLKEDRSFGAALRRLRKQRGVRREDFEPDVSAKTVARVEQGTVKRIRHSTLEALAKHLGVEPAEIVTF